MCMAAEPFANGRIERLTRVTEGQSTIGYILRQFSEWRTQNKKLWAINQRFSGITIEAGVQFKGSLENLCLGTGVIIQHGTVVHLGGTAWCLHKGYVEIGDRGVLSPNCVLYGCGPGGIRIGKNFDCGPGVGIFASRTDYNAGPNHHIFAPVVIGDDVIVYAHAVISPGVTIGDRAVIAAGAVVTRDVLPKTLVGGTPARMIRKL
jgi:acetyltransferase-like isoleucine patch superfamily enzyme